MFYNPLLLCAKYYYSNLLIRHTTKKACRLNFLTASTYFSLFQVEMKEIYTSNHMWELFENFLVDISLVSTDMLVSCRSKVLTEMFDRYSKHVHMLATSARAS